MDFSHIYLPILHRFSSNWHEYTLVCGASSNRVGGHAHLICAYYFRALIIIQKLGFLHISLQILCGFRTNLA
jgi:hypothetical protein